MLLKNSISVHKGLENAPSEVLKSFQWLERNRPALHAKIRHFELKKRLYGACVPVSL
jgi:hypothetical protein